MSVAETIKTALPLPPGDGTPVKLFGTVRSARSLQFPGTPMNNDKSEANTTTVRGKPLPKAPDEFFKDLYQFHERRGTPITHLPKVSGRIINLHTLYSEVTERGGFIKVNIRDDWDEIVPLVGFREKCLNATAAIKQIYRRFLDKYERLTFFGEDPDKLEALEASDPMEMGRSGRARYPSLYGAGNNANILNATPMSYNYRQHIVNMERRRLNKMSTDLHKATPYEKLMLSLLSPLPNEQDFAINVCTLMANESKHTLKINECPKLLDVLLAHSGVFADYTLRKLFQHVYAEVRENSLFSFWRDLLFEKSQILDLYNDDKILREAILVDNAMNTESIKATITSQVKDYLSDDFLNLRRGEGTQDYVGQRVQQIASILRNLSFFEENTLVFAKNRCFLRFVVMSANIRWGNIHIQALDAAGNVATEFELLDPTTDSLSRNLMTTICEGVEGNDRAVILNCLEILYKICQKESNEEHINKCLNLTFYETISLFLSLNDIMLLIYTLEAIYALTSMGARPCHLMMQVRGIIDQLVALITVEAQSYGPEGCILMRVVETVPGNMLPMVAQNIANLQNVAAAKHQIQQSNTPSVPILATNVVVPFPVEQELLPQQQLPVLAVANETPQAQQMPIPNQESQSVAHPTQQGTAQPTLQIPQNYTHEDEQYALAWLGAIFERAATNESRVEQQELYRMYLAHCQKSGKHSVVNHLQFPRLVRLMYNQSVGPILVRGSDGVELPGFHYVGIRVRAQPLPIQGKTTQTPILKVIDNGKIPKFDATGSARKPKKKLKPQPPPQHEQSNESIVNSIAKTDANSKQIQASDPIGSANIEQPLSTNIENAVQNVNEEQQTPGAQIVASNTADTSQPNAPSQPPSTSLIKSLLANKVTQRQQKQKELVSNPSSNLQPSATTATTAAASVITTVQQQQQPIKVASTAISALVNNPLMQNTPVKVGQTTIKPLSLSQHHIEKKTILESTPPPLAPLSGGNVSKDTTNRPVIISTASGNQMLVEIIDKKCHSLDPSQIPATIIKRKLDEETPTVSKRLALDETPVTPSKSAANLYAEMAASILEDEDIDEISTSTTATSTAATTRTTTIEQAQQPTAPLHPPQQQILRIQQPMTTVQQPVSLPNTVQRQLLFHQTSSPAMPQLKSSMTGQTQQIPTAMATIKTDQGLQTVPVILQQKPLDTSQIMQTPHLGQQTTTQYVLATNPQGQTYLVAQQTPAVTPSPPPVPTPPPPPVPTQTVLVTQTPQQQTTGAKTIIILQQQPGATSGTPQQIITTSGGVATPKMIMTTPQGQQVLVTQRPTATATQTQQQIFINPQTGAAHIQHVPTVTTSLVAAANASTHTTFPRQIIQTAVQHQHTGQISPTLLSQLNHIPATIKLHQPQPQQQQQQQQQPTTISRIGKTVSIVQANSQPPPAPSPIQIPQLQQHQSIIQQHIISGPSEKRQVILGTGRAIEIKETIITQAQPPPQQSQLNSQTIITTQQQAAPMLQQSQQMPSIIQQKITTTPIQAQQTMASAIATSKITDTSLKTPTVVQTIVPQSALAAATIKKTQMVQVISSSQQQQQQQQNPQQQLLKSATVTSASAPSKPTLATGGPPPLAAVSTTNSSQPQLAIKQQIDATTKEHKPNNGGMNSLNNITTASTAMTATVSVITTTSTAVTAGTTPTTIALPQIMPTLPQPSLPHPTLPHPTLPHPSLPTVVLPPIDPNWLYICDWRNCPRRKYKSLSDLQYHTTAVHCPDHLDAGAEIFCQWGAGPGLCDGVPRKRYSLMTHLIDRHLTVESLRSAVQRRIATGTANIHPTQPPVTIVRNVDQSQRGNTASPSSSSSSSSIPSTWHGSSALQAIKRHTSDFMNTKELMDENEGPVTKSIRLTAALILRNLVTYTSTAKRNLRRYEPHLANIALSNVESSVALSHILAELNN